MKSEYTLKYQLIVSAVCVLSMLATGLLLDRDHFRFALAGGKLSKGEEAEIKRTVEHFNMLFMDISNSMGKTCSDDLPATKGMRHNLYMNTGFNAFGQVVQVYDLASLQVTRVTLQEPGTAEVVAKEAWNYQYRNATNRKKLSEIRGMDDEFRYVLVKEHGKWLVHRFVPILKNKKPNE